MTFRFCKLPTAEMATSKPVALGGRRSLAKQLFVDSKQFFQSREIAGKGEDDRLAQENSRLEFGCKRGLDQSLQAEQRVVDSLRLRVRAQRRHASERPVAGGAFIVVVFEQIENAAPLSRQGKAVDLVCDEPTLNEWRRAPEEHLVERFLGFIDFPFHAEAKEFPMHLQVTSAFAPEKKPDQRVESTRRGRFALDDQLVGASDQGRGHEDAAQQKQPA